MYQEIVPSALSLFGVHYKTILDSQCGYRNEIWPIVLENDNLVNLTFFKRELGILQKVNNSDSVSKYLSEAGFPTRIRLDNRILVLKNRSGAKTFAALYNYLPGETIPWESYNMERIKNLGKSMSDMHYSLKCYKYQLPSVYDEYMQLVQNQKKYFSRDGVKKAMQDKLSISIDMETFDLHSTLLRKLKFKRGQQVLHMDFVRGNILFEESNVCGILDFEKTSLGHAVVDIARTLAFLLVDCKHKTGQKVFKYFLLSGYLKRGKNKKIIEADTLGELTKMFLIYDFYKFLAHNPYESLKQNEHYQRTKDILARLGVIICR